ncbi:hypothetical protein NDA16_002634 [Ustilago loliicola]|nr:hypothetical protein NDA16_002634 [Ustilago loliicola]
MVKRRQPQHFKHSPLAAENEGDPNLSKRWLTPAAIGLFAGMAFSPGLPGLVRGKQGEVDPVPFDPYDPNMLKPKDSFAVAAANPGQALPALPMQKTTQSASPDAPPALGNVVFPASAYTSSATNILQQQQLVKDAAARQRGAGNSASPSVGGSAPPPSVEGQDVLRKRAVASKDSAAAELDDTKSSAPLEKRFLFGKGPWGKVSGGLALGSIAYILYKGVTHARYRTENPRDRDIIKDLDDTPMYGAVGVPKRIPGQLATNAMPGYSDYVAKLEAQQAQQQASQQATVQRQQLAAQSATGGEGKAAADASGNDPVLRRRSVDGSSNGSPSMVGNAGQTRLERRGKLLIGGGLSVIGLALGYLQSATQFPQDRDEEKDEKKREQKKQQEQQLVMQQQALAQAAQSGGMGLAPTTAGGAAYGVAPQQMPGADTSAQSVYGTGGGSITFPDSAYGSAGSASPPATGAGSFSTHGSSGASAGGASSASAALNAVAGYSSIGGGGSGSILKKRDIPEHPNKDLETRSLSKRRPGVGSFLSIAGTTMFVGTLVGNVIMGEHQKKKPVPVVTPNANTRGPMIPGGDLYTQYLESKRPSTSGAGGASGGAGIGWGAPAMVNSQAMTPASAPAADVGQAPVVESQSVAPSSATPVTSDSSAGSEYAGGSGGADSVLKKRNVPTLHKRVFPAAAIEVETAAAELLSKGGLMAEAGSGAASLLGKGAAVSEAGAGAASAVGRGAGAASRFAPAGLRGGAVALEAGFAGLGRASMAGEGSVAAKIYQPNIAAVGSARPAMLSDLGGATGRAGMPASKKGMGFAESASTPQYSREEILKTEQKIAAARGAGLNTADNGLAKEAAARGSWTVGKTFGTVGTASSASMLFNGPG